MLWLLDLKRAPITERITIAKLEMTMHDHAWIALTIGFIFTELSRRDGRWEKEKEDVLLRDIQERVELCDGN
jgi:hypothetical protein